MRIKADGKWGRVTQKAGLAVIHRNLSNVKWLQVRVGVKPDGVWSAKSKKARVHTLKRLQKALGVKADGAFGPRSRAAWGRAVAKNRGK